MIRHFSFLLGLALCAQSLLVACGGARPIGETTTVDAESDDSGRSRRGRRARRREGADEEFPLDPASTVTGTGIRLQPPRGSDRSAMGSTFVHARRRIQIVVAAAEGDLSVHQQFRAGLVAEAEEIESEEIEIDGAEGSLVIDRMEQGENELERVWILARRGTRSVAVMGVYASDRSDALRGLVRASVLTTRFDEDAAIDPEAAVGWRVEPVEGLQLVRTASTNVSYSVDGLPPTNGGGAPMLFLVPIPIDVPASERATLCPQILAQIIQLPTGEEQLEQQAIDAGEVQGCDVAGQTGDPAQATYAALVFRGQAAFMLGGTVEASQRDPWIARFRAAARSIQPIARPADDGEGDASEGEDAAGSDEEADE